MARSLTGASKRCPVWDGVASLRAMSVPVERVVAVVLAAGESRRYGSLKLLAPLEGRPLLQHSLDAANDSTLSEVILVVGHAADEVIATVRLGRAHIVVNEAYASGQLSSLRAGLRAAAGADAVVVILGDQPRVTPALFDAVIERQRSTRSAAVVCSWRGQRSPPTLLHRDLWPALEALKGDVGAREVLMGRDDVAVLRVVRALGSLVDVDHPADLARVERP